jgi:hypothetical protein
MIDTIREKYEKGEFWQTLVVYQSGKSLCEFFTKLATDFPEGTYRYKHSDFNVIDGEGILRTWKAMMHTPYDTHGVGLGCYSPQDIYFLDGNYDSVWYNHAAYRVARGRWYLENLKERLLDKA